MYSKTKQKIRDGGSTRYKRLVVHYFTLFTLLPPLTLFILFICTIQAALHCLNSRMYANLLLGKDGMLLEWAIGLLSKKS